MIDRCVYFIRCGYEGPIKIGETTSAPHARMAALQLGCPFELHLLGAVTGYREKEIHARFSHLWIRGEWFNPARDLLEFIEAALASSGVDKWLLGSKPTPIPFIRKSRASPERQSA